MKAKDYEKLEFELQDELQRTAMIASERARNGKTSIDRVYGIETLELIKESLNKYPVGASHPAYQSINVILSSIPNMKEVLDTNDGTIDNNKVEQLNKKLQKDSGENKAEIFN